MSYWILWCQRVPLLSTDDCDQFISRTLKPLTHLPQLSLSQKVDVKDEKTFHDLLVNMTTTISASLILVKHEMNQEHKILCQPAVALGVKCHYPNMCKHVSNDHNAIFYCKLHFVHSFLENFQHFLSFKIPGTVVFPTVMDDFISLRKDLFNIFRRWYTMTLLDNTLTQTDFFQKVMKSWTHMKKELFYSLVTVFVDNLINIYSTFFYFFYFLMSKSDR